MAASPSRMQLILEEYVRRLEQIAEVNGFETDAGQTLFLGDSPELGDDDPKVAIAIVMGEQTATHVQENVRTEWPIEIQALAHAAEIERPWIAVVRVIGDIKRAMELADRTLGGIIPNPRDFQRGAVRTLDREPGSKTVGLGVTYIQSFTERWGNP